ncbi:MAG: hypothetical protein DME65_11160 [Verrucomicrobia bacterium]|nr:MAG: hypothetical protein DME65_11160 [Verrucomicrobiota bacterium]
MRSWVYTWLATRSKPALILLWNSSGRLRLQLLERPLSLLSDRSHKFADPATWFDLPLHVLAFRSLLRPIPEPWLRRMVSMNGTAKFGLTWHFPRRNL